MMGRKAVELSALEVGRIGRSGARRAPGLYAVGGVAGLHMQVAPSGARSWVLRVKIGDKRRDMGLGGFPDVGLADARQKARDARAAVELGHDPILERQQAKSRLRAEQSASKTFAWCAQAYIDAHGSGWKNPKHRAQWASTLQSYAFPALGELLVAHIEQSHVLAAVGPIWNTKNETASRVRGRIESVLDWATVRGYRQGLNPARWKGHLDKLLPAPAKVQKVEHHAALPWKEIGAFMQHLRTMPGMAALALEFAILTNTRTSETLDARWREIDLSEAVWTIPSERMKASKEHRIPLSRAALDVLERARGEAVEGSEYAFAGRAGKPLSNMACLALLKRRMNQPDLTVHGFRSTFRDWAGEATAHAREVIEHAMSHQLKDKAEAAYQRGTLFDKRRRLMNDWAAHCAAVRAAGEVLPLRRQAE